MASSMVIYDNQVPDADLSGGDWVLPLSNLQSREYDQPARSASAAELDTTLWITLSQVIAYKVVFVGFTNLSRHGQYRIRTYNEVVSPTEPAYDSGVVDGTEPVEFGSLPWSSPYLYDGLVPFDDADRKLWIIHILPAERSERHISIEFFDENNADGYVQIGRVFVGRTFGPTIGIDYGGTEGFEDNTLRQKKLNGGESNYSRVNPRTAGFSYAMLPEDEAYDDLYDLQRRAGFGEEVVWIPDPDETGLRLQRRCIYGTLTQMDPLTQAVAGYRGVGFQLKEII